MRLLRHGYGATPLHLLAHGAALALAAYALLQIIDVRAAGNIVLWLIGSVLLHDFVLLPAYSAIDRAARRFKPAGRSGVNYVRVPVGLSALLLLVYFPVISGRGNGAFRAVSGLSFDGYLERWLLLTGALLAGSAFLFVLSARKER